MIGAIWLAIKIWGLLSRIGCASGAARGWVSRNPALAALALCSTLLALCWHVIDVKDHTIVQLRADKAHFVSAQIEARRAAAAALLHQEAVYLAKANEADHGYQNELADARSAADAFIASHRLRATDVARRAGTTVGSATGGSAAIPAPVPADAVVVSSGDVQACTNAVTYAVAAHDWASANDPHLRNDAP